jgi:hypothetical protein
MNSKQSFWGRSASLQEFSIFGCAHRKISTFSQPQSQLEMHAGNGIYETTSKQAFYQPLNPVDILVVKPISIQS